jgi:hypothetical protein
MKIQDARGLEEIGDFHKFTLGGPIIIEPDGTESSSYADVVVYVESDKIEEFVKIKDSLRFYAHGYGESIK